LFWSQYKAEHPIEAGMTFDNSFFDNSLVLVRQCKNRSFYLLILLHKKVEIRINRTKTGQHLSSTNVNFDQGNEMEV
jgi:hypothetical protein